MADQVQGPRYVPYSGDISACMQRRSFGAVDSKHAHGNANVRARPSGAGCPCCPPPPIRPTTSTPTKEPPEARQAEDPILAVPCALLPPPPQSADLRGASPSSLPLYLAFPSEKGTYLYLIMCLICRFIVRKKSAMK